jgi:CspA family cold shock protein
MQGTVKWFNDKKGFGFIEGEDKQDYFVHFSEVQGDGFKTLKADETVKFEPQQNHKGPMAVQVVRT